MDHYGSMDEAGAMEMNDSEVNMEQNIHSNENSNNSDGSDVPDCFTGIPLLSQSLSEYFPHSPHGYAKQETCQNDNWSENNHSKSAECSLTAYHDQKQQKMYSEEERLKTFDGKWSETNHVMAKSCASAGFYYRGPGDSVRCAFCLCILRLFEEGDDIIEEHAKINSQCLYLLDPGKTPNIPIPTEVEMSGEPAPSIFHTWESITSHVMQSELAQNIRMVNVRNTSLLQIPEDERLFVLQREAVRLQSFVGYWDNNQAAVTAQACAAAGFYYIGPGDRVRCAFCINVLKLWDKGDIPLDEHRSAFPDCPFMMNPYSCGNIPLALDNQPLWSPAPDPFSTDITDMAALTEENQRLRDAMRCRVCLDGISDVLFLPCAHIAACQSCSTRLQLCPICRQRIHGRTVIQSS